MQKIVLASAAALTLAFPVGSALAEPADSHPPTTTAELNAPPPPKTTRVLPPAAPSEPEKVVTTYPGNLKPPPQAAFGKTYPVCTRNLQDNCRNRGASEESAARNR